MAKSKPAGRRKAGTTAPVPDRQLAALVGRQKWVLAAITLVLLLTTDDRHPGVVADGRQMDWTAIALTENGALGQARYRDLTVPRPRGDAVSRYGIAMSIAQVPAALAAPHVESARGAGSSQPLFLVAPFLFVIAAAVFAAGAARALGGSTRVEPIAMLLATVGSPLASYAALDTSEALQAAALACAYYASMRARTEERSARWGVAAGIAAGVAVLTKSSLLFVAPFACLPLIDLPVSIRRHAWVRFGAAFGACAAAWLWQEFARFGRPFASYAGEGFTHPILDGLWRLTIGVNKGVLWYFPALVAIAIGLRHAMEWPRERLLAFAGAVLPFAALLVLAAPWWAWDGAFGWGPRLVVPALPLLAAWAAVLMDDWPAAARVGLVAVSIAVNVPPLLQHPVAVMQEELAAEWPEASSDVAERLPVFARHRDGSSWRVVPHVVQSTRASASPFLDLPRAFLRAPSWHFWGRGFFANANERQYGRVYDNGLADQVIRAQQMRETDAALRLARRLVDLVPEGFSDALMMESYRLLHRDDDAVAYLSGLPMDRRQHPAINVVLALWERDRGNEQTARAFLQSVASAYPGAPLQPALTAPLNEWPSDFASMTEDPTLRVDTR